MIWTRACVVAVLLAGCTKPNEAKHCMDGTCTTPDFPFCDVSGFASGEAGTCVAVTCEAGAFGECRGAFEVRCNATGDNYDVVQCERGCDSTADGCRLCDPNETACTNGKLATCDASGAVISSRTCPLGCFEDQPRCRDVAPSNGLGSYLDMVTSPPDLDLSAGGFINTSTGQVLDAAKNPVTVPNFLVSAPTSGAAIRVFVARRVHLGNVVVGADSVNITNAGGGPALAIVADDEISVEGALTAWDPTTSPYENGLYSAGGVSFPGCTGGPGDYVQRTGPTQDLWAASGGGGHATPGGRGGGVQFMLGGGTAGAASGSPTLEPLRGGCAGGADKTGGPFIFGAGGGGGAIQLSSRVAVTLTANAVINENGGPGVVYAVQTSFYGGGAGGGILVEAPSVSLGEGSKLLVNGGPAAAPNDYSPPTSETTAASLGGKCTSSGTYYCGNGGNGAGADGPATDGAEVAYVSTANYTFQASGGGGGLGYIRINTPTGNYTKASNTIESGVLTTGMLKTR